MRYKRPRMKKAKNPYYMELKRETDAMIQSLEAHEAVRQLIELEKQGPAKKQK